MLVMDLPSLHTAQAIAILTMLRSVPVIKQAAMCIVLGMEC